MAITAHVAQQIFLGHVTVAGCFRVPVALAGPVYEHVTLVIVILALLGHL
jgi:hypothetical protein